MLKIHNYSSWLSVYKSDLDASLRLISPENVNGPDDGRYKIFYELPWRIASELQFIHREPNYAVRNLDVSDDDLGVISNAHSFLHERVVYATVRRESLEILSPKNSEFALFLKMLLETPVAILLHTVGEASLHVSSFHGFTNLRLEKVGKSIRAKISHHQNDPTMVYGMPDILNIYAWESTFVSGEYDSQDTNGFQAIYDLPKLDFEEALDAIVSTFTEALANSIHSLVEPDNSDNRLVLLHLDTHNSDFDSYLSEHNSFVQKFWMHHFLHVRLNERNE